MVKKIIVFTGLSLILSTTALAGGSIFGGHKTRTSNPDGVNSIGIHICGSLNCPDVILKNGDCGTVEHATVKYGVCVCDEGYKADNDKCVPISQENCNKTGEKWCSALNQCVNSTDCCTGLTVSECQVCNSDTGEITDKNEGLCTVGEIANGGYCFNGECLNPCEINPVENCKRVFLNPEKVFVQNVRAIIIWMKQIILVSVENFRVLMVSFMIVPIIHLLLLQMRQNVPNVIIQIRHVKW